MPAGSVIHYIQCLHKLVNEQADDIQPTMDRIMRTAEVGSPADKDYKSILRSVRSEDRQELWQRTYLGCLHMAVNVADHVRAVAVLLSQPPVGLPVFAHSTLARIAIESAANIAYIIDSTASFELRFARGIAFLVNDADWARKAANDVPGNPYMPAPGTAYTQNYKLLLNLIQQARIEIIPGNKGNPKSVRVATNAPDAPINVKASELVKNQYPSLPAIYKILSGVTHGLPYALANNSQLMNRNAEWDPNPIDIGGSVLAIINAAHTTLTAFAWHRGLENDTAIAKAQERIAAVDAAIQRFGRKHLVLPRPNLTEPYLA